MQREQSQCDSPNTHTHTQCEQSQCESPKTHSVKSPSVRVYTHTHTHAQCKEPQCESLNTHTQCKEPQCESQHAHLLSAFLVRGHPCLRCFEDLSCTTCPIHALFWRPALPIKALCLRPCMHYSKAQPYPKHPGECGHACIVLRPCPFQHGLENAAVHFFKAQPLPARSISCCVS